MAALHDDLPRMRDGLDKGETRLAVSGRDLPQRGDPRPGRRLLLTTRGRDPELCLLLRDPQPPPPDPETLSRLCDVAGLLLSAAARHAERALPRPHGPAPLACVDEIETRLADAAVLSKREIQICARMLHGLTSLGIALDLGVGRESVATYRKRAYRRLGIASQRELLVWYLDLRERAAQTPETQPADRDRERERLQTPPGASSRRLNPSSTTSTRKRS